MTETEFLIFMRKVAMMGSSGETVSEIVLGMMNMLDATDADDYFGTEGWRRDFGWETN